jgi:hypothetical protein
LFFFFVTYLSFSFSAEQQTEGPSIDLNALNNDGSAKSLDAKKSTIGQRRAPQAKKVDLFFFVFDKFKWRYLERIWCTKSNN